MTAPKHDAGAPCARLEAIMRKHKLPPAHARRWTSVLKKRVIDALGTGALTRHDIAELYSLSDDEIDLWLRSLQCGVAVLQATHTPAQRQRRVVAIPPGVRQAGTLTIDPEHGLVSAGMRSVRLTGQEAKIAVLLASAGGGVVSRETLLDALYHHLAVEPAPKVIDVFVCHLRAKLEKLGAQPIDTVWGRGYIWRQ